MTMLDLPSLLPHHSGKPIFFAEESEEVDTLIEDILLKGYFDVPKALEVLGRPLAMYLEKKQSLYFTGEGGDSLLSVSISDLQGLLKNFRKREYYGRLVSHDLYEVSEDYFAMDLGNGYNFLVSKPAARLHPTAIDAFLWTSQPENLIEDLQGLAMELGQPVGLFSTVNNRIALFPPEGEWFVPLELTEVMDFVTFFS